MLVLVVALVLPSWASPKPSEPHRVGPISRHKVLSHLLWLPNGPRVCHRLKLANLHRSCCRFDVGQDYLCRKLLVGGYPPPLSRLVGCLALPIAPLTHTFSCRFVRQIVQHVRRSPCPAPTPRSIVTSECENLPHTAATTRDPFRAG